MKGLFTIFIAFLILLTLSCHQEIKNQLKVNFQGNGYIKILNKDTNSTLRVNVRYIDLLLQRYLSFDNYEIKKNENSIYSFPLFLPSQINLNINDNEFNLFLIPNDTLFVQVYSEGDENKIKFLADGELQNSNIFLQVKQEIYNENFNQQKSNLFMQQLLANDFKNSIDSLTDKELSLFDKYQNRNRLSDIFVNYETSNAKYSSLHFKNTFHSWNKVMLGKEVAIDKSYYDYLNDISLNDAKARYNSIYYYFLYTYFNQNFKTNKFNFETSSNDKTYNYLKGNFAIADSLLEGEVKDIYKFRILYKALTGGFKFGANKFLKDHKNVFQNTNFSEYLNSQLNDNDLKVEGKKIINFYSQNAEGESITFNQFLGETVLLEVYAPGCHACKNEISYEKELLNQLKGEEFTFVSVCFTKDFNNFLLFLEKYNKSGTTVFANSNWQSILANKYNIGSYPHYILLDKNGVIVENNCKSPSQGIINDIKDIL